jgi:hypothetical protein
VGGTRVEIDSVNDGKSAQATTSRQMARFFSLIQLEKLIDDSVSSEGMKELLHEANTIDPSWLILDWSRSHEVSLPFKVVGVKVGVANLKPNTPPLGPNVYSEGIIAKWEGDATALTRHNLNGDIAVCWQNLRAGSISTHFEGIAEVIKKTVGNFVKRTPI